MRPLESIEAEKPVLAAITSGLRHSIARNTPHIRCRSSSLEPQNQPSFVTLTRLVSVLAPWFLAGFAELQHLAADDVRHHGFVADARTHRGAGDLAAACFGSGGEAAAERRQFVEPGEARAERHVLAEEDRVHFVVARAERAVAGDEEGGVEALVVVAVDFDGVDAEKERDVERAGQRRDAGVILIEPRRVLGF